MIKQKWACPIDGEITITCCNELVTELFCTQHGVRRINESSEKIL